MELCFKWIQQHLRIQAFFGTSENAVKTHILNKRHALEPALFQILQVLSVTFEKTPILRAFGENHSPEKYQGFSSQLNLLDL